MPEEENKGASVSGKINFSFEAIGIVESPYQEKFAIPRQPNLVTAAKGKVLLNNEANNAELLRGIEQFSHLWLIFVFHGTQDQGWKPLVRPPRLGGNTKTGVLATRSTFRPNPIGMSVVKLDKVTTEHKQVTLHISGLDLLNATPILDIKPYLPYSDAVYEAQAGFAEEAPKNNNDVIFSDKVEGKISSFEKQFNDLTLLIEQILLQDPRPAYKRHKPDPKTYGMALYNFNIKWKFVTLTTIEVLDIEVVTM